jgi:hypothetical protein
MALRELDVATIVGSADHDLFWRRPLRRGVSKDTR